MTFMKIISIKHISGLLLYLSTCKRYRVMIRATLECEIPVPQHLTVKPLGFVATGGSKAMHFTHRGKTGG